MKKATILVLILLCCSVSLVFGQSTYSVTNTSDSGSGSIRQALVDANASPDASVITFSIPGAGVHTVTLSSDLPVITAPVTIDGWSQGGLGYTATPLLEIDGAAVIGGIGLNIQSPNVTVRGLAIMSFQQFVTGGNGVGIGI
ncbi:MAG: Hemolysin-type calcium-binding region, partial [Bacteroidetes bacterium]|nr:Hemolysin-type calcium-binding region [Bacteroidota bacterium]